MFFSRPIQWYHSHADSIWPDGTFKMIKSMLSVILQQLFNLNMRVKYDVEYAGCGVRQLMLYSSVWIRAWTCFRFRSEKSFQVAGSTLLLSLFAPAQPL
jgi:hypothetical protein